MDSLCGFPLDKTCVRHVDTHQQHKDKQETHVEPLCRKAACIYPGKGLDVCSDCVCGIGDKVQLVGFLHHVPCGVGDIHTHCPYKVSDGVQAVLDTLADTVQPVPRQPIP